MYIYFDSNGVLREIINDKAVRQGDLNANEVLVYIENVEPADIWITFRKPGGAFSTEKSFITNKITKEIPYNKNRDMRYFKDLTEYTFYKFVISDEITEAGTYEATIRFTYADSLVALGKFVFNAEPSVIKQDNLITQAQYNYLIWYVGSWQGQIGNLASGIATLNSEITTIKSRLDTNEANITNLLSNYVKKTSLTTNSSQSIKPVVNGDFITFEIRNLQSSDNLIKTDNENGIYVSANGVISLVSARIVSDSNLRNAIKGVVYEVGTTKDWQSGTQVNSKITTHDENTTAHAYLRGLINDISQEIARIDARGRSYGELDKTLSELLLESDKDLYIYNYLTNKYSGYENQVGNLIYTKVSDNEPEHELEYNGTNWVDNGAYLISKADNTQFGMVKGDNEYISILNGLIQVLKSDYATRLGTSGANYTYSDLLNTLTQFATDLANRYTKAETLFELEQRITDLLSASVLQDTRITYNGQDTFTYTNQTPVVFPHSVFSEFSWAIMRVEESGIVEYTSLKPAQAVNGIKLELAMFSKDEYASFQLLNGNWQFSVYTKNGNLANTTATLRIWGVKLGNINATEVEYSSGVSVKQKLDDLELLNKINLVDISVAGKYHDLVIGSYINSSGAITGTGDYYRRYVYNEPKFKYIKFGGYGATSVSAIAFYNSTQINESNLISSVVYPSGHNDAIYEDYAEIPSNCKCVVFSTRTDKGSYYVYGTILKDITLLKESVSNLNDICYVDNGEEYGINVIGKYIAVNGTDTGTGNYYQETIFNNPKFKCIKVKGCGNVIVSALAFYNSTTISSTNLISSIPYPYGYNKTPYEITAKVPENCACVVFSTRNDRGVGTYYVKPSFEITQDKEESENLQLVVHIEQGGLNTTNLSSSNTIPAGTILKVVVASLAEGTAVQDIRMFNSSDNLNSCVVMTDTVGTFYLKANTNINRIYSAQSTRNIEYYVYKVMSPQVAFKNDLIYPVKAHNEKKTLQKGDLIFKNEYWYYNNNDGAYKGYANHAYLSTQLFLKDAKNLKINFADNTGKSFQYTIQRFFGGSKTISTGWITNASQTISVDGCENVIIMLRIDGSTFVDLDDLKGIELSVELDCFVEDYVSKTSMVKHLNEANRSFKQFPFNFGKQIGHLFINEAFSNNGQTIPCQSIYDVDAQKRMGFKVIHSNCKPTATSGKYVMCHGNGNYLGDQFEGLNGANPATTNVTTSTFDYLRENFVYKSRYVKYKKPITELEEWLKQVKRCNAIPCVQYVDEAQVKIIEKYFPTDYILYGGNRGVTKSWIYLYFSNLTPQNYKVNLSRVISVVGLPLIIAIQHAENFTDEELLDMANFTHENGAYIGIVGCYEQDNQTERCYRAGFDFNISGYEVNQFEDGNLENLTDFEEFGTDGTILSDETLKLTEGQTIWFNCDKKGFVNKAGVKIIFSGKINVSCGAYNGTNIVNDGKQTSWFSSFIIDDYPAFSITAVEDTIITDIKFVASKC